jgi:hypothetical protein
MANIINKNFLLEAEKNTGNIFTRALKYKNAKGKLIKAQKQMETDIFNKVINPFYKKALDYKNKMDTKTEEVEKMQDSYRAKELKKMLRDQFREFQIKQLRDLNNAIDKLMSQYEKKVNIFITSKSLLGGVITEKGQLTLQTLWTVLSTASKQKFWKKLEDDALGWVQEVKTQISTAMEQADLLLKQNNEKIKEFEKELVSGNFSLQNVEEYFNKQKPPIEFQKEYSYVTEASKWYVIFSREGDKLSMEKYQKNNKGEKINGKTESIDTITPIIKIVNQIIKKDTALFDYLKDNGIELDEEYKTNDLDYVTIKFIKKNDSLFIVENNEKNNGESEKEIKSKWEINKIVDLINNDLNKKSGNTVPDEDLEDEDSFGPEKPERI